MRRTLLFSTHSSQKLHLVPLNSQNINSKEWRETEPFHAGNNTCLPSPLSLAVAATCAELCTRSVYLPVWGTSNNACLQTGLRTCEGGWRVSSGMCQGVDFNGFWNVPLGEAGACRQADSFKGVLARPHPMHPNHWIWIAEYRPPAGLGIAPPTPPILQGRTCPLAFL